MICHPISSNNNHIYNGDGSNLDFNPEINNTFSCGIKSEGEEKIVPLLHRNTLTNKDGYRLKTVAIATENS